MKRYLNAKNLIRLAVLVLDLILALMIISSYKSSRRSEASRVSKLKKEVQAEMEASLEGSMSMVEEVKEDDESKLPTVFSVRGDSFSTETNAIGTDYPYLLEQLLIESGTVNSVMNYTIDEVGTLADLYYAGVPDEKINSFLELNRSKNLNGIFGDVETSLGDVQKLKRGRVDYNAIPIIFIGYYGGWAEDPYELIEQQKAILNTYSQQKYFLIVGTHPNNYPDTEKFDSVMNSYWGDHYLNLSSKVAAYKLSTEEGHQQIAEAILKRLKTLQLVTMADVIEAALD